MTKVEDLFVLQYGHSLEFNRLTVSSSSESVNFVSRTVKNNGVSARVSKIEGVEPAEAGTITVALNGQGGAGEAFLQPFPYYTGYHIMVLTARAAMTDLEKLWWVRCITANRFRFGFGRQANKTLALLSLPSPDSVPQWVQSASLDPFKDGRAPFSDTSPTKLDPENWGPFRYDALFDIKKGQRLTKAKMSSGETPFIGAIDANNGYRQRVGSSPNHLGNTITVNYNGSVAEAFYQPDPFWASDDVNVLYPRFKLNSYVAMFICALIKRERFRFNYGRKWHLDRMRESILWLPLSPDGRPNWHAMESYIKALPYSRAI